MTTLKEIDVLGVCGFGRCGSSLMMQMLAASGVPVTGNAEYPAYEDDRVGDGLRTQKATWLRELHGEAVKLIDPQLYELPTGPRYKFIWLDRDPDEQAKSQLKFAAAFLLGSVRQDRAARKALAASYRRDRPRAMARLATVSNVAPLIIGFESLLYYPERIAAELATAIIGLDAARMAACVRKRSPKCYPGMMEIELLETQET